jgi:predicted SprT family Zn-dependent metalloprotease
VAVNKELTEKIEQAREKVKAVTAQETAAFNQRLKSDGFTIAIEP